MAVAVCRTVCLVFMHAVAYQGYLALRAPTGDGNILRREEQGLWFITDR